MKRTTHEKRVVHPALTTVVLIIALLAASRSLYGIPTIHAASKWLILHGHLVSALRRQSPMHATASENTLQLSVALNLRNRSALHQLLADQKNPKSPEYHRYITPQEFIKYFGADQATIDATIAYLRSQGLRVESISPNHLFIDASGSVADAQRAFNVSIADYALGSRTVYAPMNEPSVPGVAKQARFSALAV